MSREKRLSRSLLELKILALRNETICSGFLWYLVAPLIAGFLHDPSVSRQAKLVKTASQNMKIDRFMFIYANHLNPMAAKIHGFLTNLESTQHQILLCRIERTPSSGHGTNGLNAGSASALH